MAGFWGRKLLEEVTIRTRITLPYHIGQDLTKTTLPDILTDRYILVYECESFVYESERGIVVSKAWENPAQCHVEYPADLRVWSEPAMASFESACANDIITLGPEHLTWFDLSKGKLTNKSKPDDYVVVRYRKLSLERIRVESYGPPEPDGRVSALTLLDLVNAFNAETVYTPLTTIKYQERGMSFVIDFNHHHSQIGASAPILFIIFL
ncbi:hypothetical protein SPFM15_00191 [Salmonella phage SPFM15]|nr:hypothetical protein SPFM5_00186 [Salmonella phage SPFM5]VFR13815.1 hypothetical protein SPFM15_00191 [Salmonella phage SPFM15]